MGMNATGHWQHQLQGQEATFIQFVLALLCEIKLPVMLTVYLSWKPHYYYDCRTLLWTIM
jgi:hypothetical protein